MPSPRLSRSSCRRIRSESVARAHCTVTAFFATSAVNTADVKMDKSIATAQITAHKASCPPVLP